MIGKRKLAFFVLLAKLKRRHGSDTIFNAESQSTVKENNEWCKKKEKKVTDTQNKKMNFFEYGKYKWKGSVHKKNKKKTNLITTM